MVGFQQDGDCLLIDDGGIVIVLCCIGRNWDGMRGVKLYVLFELVCMLRGDEANNNVGVSEFVNDCGGGGGGAFVFDGLCLGVVFVVYVWCA